LGIVLISFGLWFWFRIFEAGGKYQIIFNKIKKKLDYLLCTQESRSDYCRMHQVPTQRLAMKRIIAILSICFLPAISHAWFDEPHLAIAEAAGYSKWYNAAAADLAKVHRPCQN
jgi:hypothetical protein